MFKVGDKVRVTDFKGVDADYINNRVGTIIQIPSGSGIWDCLVDIPPKDERFTSTPVNFCELSLLEEERFSVGDKVRVIDYHNVITGMRDKRYIGKIGIVISVWDNMVSTDIPDNIFSTTSYFKNELELVKDEFEVGDRVKVKKVSWNHDIIGKTGVIIGTAASICDKDMFIVVLDDTTDCPVGVRHQKYHFYKYELELID